MAEVYPTQSEDFPENYKHIALIGNPGAGKSTILNGLAGRAVFESGISLGGGLTTVIDTYQDDGKSRVLYDTPGLSDIVRAKEAARQLEGLLRQGVSFRICFVVTLEEGRVRPDDAAMIEIILDSIQCSDMTDRFAVIINKVDVDIFEALDQNEEHVTHMKESIVGEFKTSYWLPIPRVAEMSGKRNKQLRFPEIEEFISSIPVSKETGTKVSNIDATSLQELIDSSRRKVRDLHTKFEESKRKAQQEHETEIEKAIDREKELKGLLDQCRPDSDIPQISKDGSSTSTHRRNEDRNSTESVETPLDLTVRNPFNLLRKLNAGHRASSADTTAEREAGEGEAAERSPRTDTNFQQIISLIIRRGQEIMQRTIARGRQ